MPIVGTPKTPRAIAWSVASRSALLDCRRCAGSRARRELLRRARQGAAASSASAPPRQTWCRTCSQTMPVRRAAGPAQAQARRSSASGLNGCCARRLRSGCRARCASQWTWRKVQARFGSISAGPLCAQCLQQAAEEHRPVGDAVREPVERLGQALEREVRIGRDRVEPEVDLRHGVDSGWRCVRRRPTIARRAAPAGASRRSRFGAVVERAPGGDLVDRAQAPVAPAGARLDRADADAGAGDRGWRARAHDPALPKARSLRRPRSSRGRRRARARAAALSAGPKPPPPGVETAMTSPARIGDVLVLREMRRHVDDAVADDLDLVDAAGAAALRAGRAGAPVVHHHRDARLAAAQANAVVDAEAAAMPPAPPEPSCSEYSSNSTG